MCSPPKPTRSCTELSHGLTTLRTECSTLTLLLVWRCWHCQWLSSSQWRQRVEFCTFAPDLYMYMCVCVVVVVVVTIDVSAFNFDMLTCKLPKRFPKHNYHIHTHAKVLDPNVTLVRHLLYASPQGRTISFSDLSAVLRRSCQHVGHSD